MLLKSILGSNQDETIDDSRRLVANFAGVQTNVDHSSFSIRLLQQNLFVIPHSKKKDDKENHPEIQKM
jgi:hypothetical protein